MFYREVLQAILIYGLEMWVILAEMEIKVEGVYTGFLRQITENRSHRIGYGMWETPGEEVVWEAAGT